MINLLNLNQNFGSLEVLDNIELSIKKGEVVAIVGPSGCGKTTLLRCVAGLNNDYTGTIHIDGLNHAKYLKRKRIAVVSQKYSNFEWLTVAENIKIAYLNEKTSKKQINKHINDLVRNMNLLGFADNYMNQLSGGMQQRVAVARAFAQNTEIMALDEPFGALDIQNRNALQLLFKGLIKKFHKTAIFVTHDIEEAMLVADKVVILSERPSTIVKIFDTKFDDENNEGLKYSRAFIERKKEIEEEL